MEIIFYILIGLGLFVIFGKAILGLFAALGGIIAIIIPIIPNKFPCLDVSGEDNPLNAKINNTPEIKYNIAERFADI